MSREIPDPDDVEKLPDRRFGCLFYAISFLLVIGVGLIVAYRVWYSSASKSLQVEMDRIKARGEPLWFSELAPLPVDPADDATPLFFAALKKFQKPPPAFYALVGPEPPAPPTLPGKYDVFESALADNRPVLELIGLAVRRPYFRLPIDYRTKQPFTIMLEPVQQSRDLSQLLAADVLQSIGAGDNDRAVAAVLDELGLAELMRDEPFLIVQLVRVGIAAQAVESLQTVLATVELTPEQFAAIDDQLALMESRFRLAPGVRSERAMLLTSMNSLGGTAKEMAAMIGSGAPATPLLSVSRLGPLRMRDEAFMLRLMTGFADAADVPGPEGMANIRRLEAELKPSFEHIISRLLAPSILNAREAGFRHRQRLTNARLGLRVTRFFSEHGKLPDSLDDCTDEKLGTVSPDLYSGAPLVYRKLPDAFVIYPVGDNGVDDGGGIEPDRQEQAAKFEVRCRRAAAAEGR